VISVTHELLEKVDAAAKDSGVSRSKWLRQVALDALSPVEEPEVVVQVPVAEPSPIVVPTLNVPPGMYLRSPKPNHAGHKKVLKASFVWCDNCKCAV